MVLVAESPQFVLEKKKTNPQLFFQSSCPHQKVFAEFGKIQLWNDLRCLSQFSNAIDVTLDTHSIQIKANNHHAQEICYGQDILVVSEFIS